MKTAESCAESMYGNPVEEHKNQFRVERLYIRRFLWYIIAAEHRFGLSWDFISHGWREIGS